MDTFTCIFIYIFAAFLAHYIYSYIKNSKYAYLLEIIVETFALTVLFLNRIKGQSISWVIYAIVIILGIIVPIVYIFLNKKYNYLLNLFNTFSAYIYLLFKQYDKSLEILKKLPNQKNDYYIQKMLAEVYLQQNKFKESMEATINALEKMPNDISLMFDLACIYYQLNEKEKAIKVLRDILSINAIHLPTNNFLSNILCMNKEFNQALKIYFDLIKTGKANWEIYYNIAIVYMNQSNFVKAQENLEKSIKMNRKAYISSYMLAQILVLSKKYDEAEKQIYLCINNCPELIAKAQYVLAQIYVLKSENGKAVTILKMAIDSSGALLDKALKDPVFNSIKDFIKGIIIISDSVSNKKHNQKVKTRIELFKEQFSKMMLNEEVLVINSEKTENVKNAKKKNKKVVKE